MVRRKKNLTATDTSGKVAVRIEKIADRGTALARLGGKALFVPFAAPGDLAEVKIVSEKKSHAMGELLTILEPSPSRREPLCPLYGECGGCAWQHVDHETQIAGKSESLKGFFRSRLRLEEDVFRPPVRSPLSYGYRNRITVGLGLSGKTVTPLMTRRRSHGAVEILSCPVASPRVNEGLSLVKSLHSKYALGAERLLIQEDLKGALHFVFESRLKPGGAALGELNAFMRSGGAASAWVKSPGGEQVHAGGGDPLPMNFSDDSIAVPPVLMVRAGSFVQANNGVNRGLIESVLECAPLYEGRPALDLYCGSGNFTRALAPYASHVTGVEGDRIAAGSAAANARANGFSSVHIETAPVEEYFGRKKPDADFWLLDPPRTGAPETVLAAIGMKPETILYISCSPETLARDAGVLLQNGYRIEYASAADMFPQTAHLEAVMLLRRL